MFHSFFKGSGIRCPVSCVHAMNEYVLVWTDSTTKKKHPVFFPTRYFTHQVAAHTCARYDAASTQPAYRISASHVSYHSSATRVSQLKICDFSEETFKGFEVL